MITEGRGLLKGLLEETCSITHTQVGLYLHAATVREAHLMVAVRLPSRPKVA